MPDLIKDMVRATLNHVGLAVVKQSNLQELIEYRSRVWDDMELLSGFPDSQASQLLKLMPNSRAQLRQDLFVLSELNFKSGGFFVEFGATNGVDLSNTCLLEREFGWDGILAEPAKRWHGDLRKNRKCFVETDCVWRESDCVLTFNEAKRGEYSTIDSYSASDYHRNLRKQGDTYQVKTISLEALLDKYRAPKVIDYLSIDTEGSEYEILKAFNFDKYQFRIITCEHNFAPQKELISSLLAQHGYVLKYQELSKFDYWYVKQDAN